MACKRTGQSVPSFHQQDDYRRQCAGFDLKVATQCLLAQGWIVPGGDGRPTQKPRLPGIGLARVYVFTNKWADAE